MRNDFLALRAPLLATVLFAIVLAANWGAVSLGYAGMLVPSPQSTAESFLQAVYAHRFEAAHELLGEPLRGQVSKEDLRDLADSLETRHGPISGAYGGDEHEEGENATATVLLRFDGGKETNLAFQLIKEDGLWKVSSLQPLLNLAS